MPAQVGADDLELFLDPQPQLLEAISGMHAESSRLHVLLDGNGVRSTQRLALSGIGGGLVAGLWPAELKEQALYLYGRGLATPMIARARELGWTALPAPQLAFRSSAPSQRLYMLPKIDAADYARRWEGADLMRVGQYHRDEVRSSLWPWLIDRGYVEEADEPALALFLDRHLGNRPAFLRPGLRLRRRWNRDATEPAEGVSGLVTAVRADVNGILAAALEPPLPAGDVAMAASSPDGQRQRATEEARPPSTSQTFVRRARIPERVRHEVWRRDQGRCVDCGSRERLEFDHIVPVAKGGSNTVRNVELRCELCNRRKGSRT